MMDYENRDEWIIKKYQQDEQIMIQLFVQWCLNYKLDPLALYERAYPGQLQNEALAQTVKETAEDPERVDISHATLLEVLQLFGNDDLAFVVSEEMEKLPEE